MIAEWKTCKSTPNIESRYFNRRKALMSSTKTAISIFNDDSVVQQWWETINRRFGQRQ